MDDGGKRWGIIDEHCAQLLIVARCIVAQSKCHNGAEGKQATPHLAGRSRDPATGGKRSPQHQVLPIVSVSSGRLVGW